MKARLTSFPCQVQQNLLLHVYMCQSGKLSQHIKVSTGSAPGLAKGSMTAAFEQGRFDLGSPKDVPDKDPTATPEGMTIPEEKA